MANDLEEMLGDWGDAMLQKAVETGLITKEEASRFATHREGKVMDYMSARPDLDDETKALQAVIDGWYESDYTHDSLAEAIIAAGWRKTLTLRKEISGDTDTESPSNP